MREKGKESVREGKLTREKAWPFSGINSDRELDREWPIINCKILGKRNKHNLGDYFFACMGSYVCTILPIFLHFMAAKN